jgi:hypothetical protein
MSDSDQPGEDFDDDLLAGEYPPDEPLVVKDEGVTEVEQLGGESFGKRDERTLPETWDEAAGQADSNGPPGVELLDDADGGLPDDGELLGERAGPPDDLGPLAPDDGFSGDETTRDVVTERIPQSAEDAAVHIDDEEPPPGS